MPIVAELVLGVDGGGTKTRALLADRSGRIVGRGSAGTSNYLTAGFEAATSALRMAITAARQDAAYPATLPVAAACFGLAGVGRPADIALIDAWLAEQHFATSVSVVNDAELVLAAGTPQGWGVALICGTGSICYGRSQDGRSARTGGWGHVLGDEGGGYDIAVQALRLATQTADGRFDAPTILDMVLTHWHLSTPDQLVDCIYNPPRSRAEIATLAQPVIALAESGDTYAASILDHAASELARMIATVGRRLGIAQPAVALGGGLIGASEHLRHSLRTYTDIAALTQVDEPAQGALVLARRLLDHTPAQ